MMNNPDNASFKWSLILSLFIHASAFLVFKTQLEYRRINIFQSGLPVQLRYYDAPEQEKKKEAKKPEKKIKKKKTEEVYNKKNIKKKAVKPPEPKSEPPKPPRQTVAVIDIKNFPYPTYLRDLEKKIGNNWVMPAQLEGLLGRQAVIYFRIMRDGEINGVRVDENSGEAGLDISGLRAVKNSAPFPPLPSGFDEEYLIVRFHFKIR